MRTAAGESSAERVRSGSEERVRSISCDIDDSRVRPRFEAGPEDDARIREDPPGRSPRARQRSRTRDRARRGAGGYAGKDPALRSGAEMRRNAPRARPPATPGAPYDGGRAVRRAGRFEF